jgi:hypothetical protein
MEGLGFLFVLSIILNIILFDIVFKNQKFISDNIDELKEKLDSKK